jgi:peptidyl-prolyl cis-trans isomerase C
LPGLYLLANFSIFLRKEVDSQKKMPKKMTGVHLLPLPFQYKLVFQLFIKDIFMKLPIFYRTATLALSLLASIPTIYGEPVSSASDSTVVSKVTIDGNVVSITLGQIKDKLKLLPPQLQNAPFNDIFPLLQKSVATEEVVKYFAEKTGLKDSPEYAKMVEECKKGVLQKLFLDKKIDEKATDEELKKAYEEVKKAAPKEDEYNISMITVTDKKKANSVLADLKKSGTSKFADVANKESMNKIPDGNLGYVRLGDLPEAFRDKVKDAAKATLVPSIIEVSMPESPDSTKKVTTYNIIFVQDKRPAAFPAFENVKAELKTAVGQKFAKEAIKELEDKAKIENFTMDGKPIEAPKTDDKKPEEKKTDGKPVDDSKTKTADTSAPEKAKTTDAPAPAA